MKGFLIESDRSALLPLDGEIVFENLSGSFTGKKLTAAGYCLLDKRSQINR